MQRENVISAEAQEQLNELKRGTEEVIPEKELLQKIQNSLDTKIPLKVKAGFDPTAPDLHLGHTVLLQKMRQFQKFGHEVSFLIGDFTGLIGDPTGKSQTRKPLTQEEVLKNAETYKEQVFKILDPKKTKVVFNSQWLASMSLKDVLELTGKYTVARMLERDDFSKRYQGGQPISVVEFMYPLIQGYDSVAMESDIELGGTDQKFNLLVGRDLQPSYGKKPQCILTMPLLVGLDGEKKMSKSLGNYIGIQEPAIEIYGKLMSISDTLMWDYYRLLSDLSISDIDVLKKKVETGGFHPKEAKAQLATEITTRFHSPEAAGEARSQWEHIHSPDKRGTPDGIPATTATNDDLQNGKLSLINALRLCGFASSNGEARRLIEGGGVHKVFDDGREQGLTDVKLLLEQGQHILRAGKRRFAMIKIP